ncbi:hypothetical protein B7463_g7219, partial [Scytalidium lignicola]
MREEDSNTTIKPLSSIILDLPPSCIEFSPENRNYFVVGTYNLQKDEDTLKEKGDYLNEQQDIEAHPSAPQSRNGSLILFKIIEDKPALVQTLSYHSAILDLHFSPHTPSIFAIASSTGSISTFKLTNDAQPSIKHLKTHQLFPQDTLVLSFAWHPTLPSILSVTLSTGAVHVLKLHEELTDSIEFAPNDEPLITHSLEAWCSAFSPSSSLLNGKQQCALYSGGDDGHLNVATFALNTPENPIDKAEDDDMGDPFELRPAGLMRNTRPSHDAGLTAILPIPFRADDSKDILITGSYDDHVRICAADPSQLLRGPTVLSKLYIGGGVWRLNFLEDYGPQEQNGDDLNLKILASCMHAGARILEVRHNKDWSIKVLGEVTDHKSMCYGSAVQPLRKNAGKGEDEGRLCVSTSFYDRLLCIWRFNARSG